MKKPELDWDKIWQAVENHVNECEGVNLGTCWWEHQRGIIRRAVEAEFWGWICPKRKAAVKVPVR